MNIKTPHSTVMPGAEAIFLKGTNKKAVLLLHGFLGSPAEMSYQGKKLHEKGYTVMIPRHPGHGTSLREMTNSSLYIWYKTVRETYLELKTIEDEIFVMGLSMGGLFSLNLAKEFNLHKIAIISVPMDFNPFQAYFLGLVSIFKKILWQTDEKRGLNWIEARENHVSYTEGLPLRQAWQLYRFMLKTRRSLKSVTSQTLIIQSKGDEVIPQQSADIIYKKLGSTDKKIHYFTKSNHCLTVDYDRDDCANLIYEFIRDN